MSEDTLATEGTVSAPELEVNGTPDTPTSPVASPSAAAADGERHGRDVLNDVDRDETSVRAISQDRRARLRLLTGSLVGVGCLVLAFVLQPGGSSPFAGLSSFSSGIALIAGIAGISLVPGLWMSAVVMRIGVGPAARLATRIGATLAWYALVGPVIHLAADDAVVTRGGVFGVTVAATAAVCLGVALGLVRRPANPWVRFLAAGVVGTLCAQTVIWLSMLLADDGVDYAQIRRLDWVIVLSCGVLTAIGAQSRPDLPLVRSVKHVQTILISLAVVAVTAGGLFAVGSIWSPAQRSPSAFGAEQVAPPSGSDVAFALSAIGPDGPSLIQNADFTAADVMGRPVAINTRVLEGGEAEPTMLLVTLGPESRPQLCERSVEATDQGWPIKLTVRDQASGLVVQGVIPAQWCVA